MSRHIMLSFLCSGTYSILSLGLVLAYMLKTGFNWCLSQEKSMKHSWPISWLVNVAPSHRPMWNRPTQQSSASVYITMLSSLFIHWFSTCFKCEDAQRAAYIGAANIVGKKGN